VCDFAIAPILEGLRSSNASDAWVEFLRSYGPVLYQAARTYSSSQDAAAECYVYICEQLADNRFKRLLKFNMKGRASFTTWLRVVARNLCFDWHRTQSGRYRPFKSLDRLSPLELEIYRWRFAQGASQHEALQQLAPRFPGISLDELCAVEGRIHNSLTSQQRWILSTRRKSEISTPVAVAGEDGDLEMLHVRDQRPDPETQLITVQERKKLRKSLTLLPADERLLLQLRFEHDLSLDEVARLCGLGDGQRVHRKLTAVLTKLRSLMR
jgi:RNA polymerase sigma factor (sigma-70 family)